MKKTVLITGGSKGIGLATARYLLKKEFAVLLLARSAAGLDSARSSLVDGGAVDPDIQTCVLDVADADAIAGLVPLLETLPGGLFGLINNAASEIIKPVSEYTLQEMETMWRVNALAPVLLIQACLPYLKKAGGSVVNIGSISDHRFCAGYSYYGGTKAFLASFTKHAGHELGFEGIRINSVSPGGIDTPLMQEIEAQFPAERIAAIKAAIPIGQRWGRAEEIAETIHFALTGPAYLHGADLRVHGGVY
jgi:NAD(P)-dependent dehydrogenase (short-subunit alcohol dehydrogenase family)